MKCPRLDHHWRTSLLAAIARCDTLDALQFLWRRWVSDVATCEWKAELIEAKDRRKMELSKEK